ncbi:MAG: M23 family metallopeptidase [Acidobacteria bacterium]|nr:M23 family metallopeptidase [Acidobacteriota bacterium]
MRPIDKTREVLTLGGAIDHEASSLFAALDRIGERPELSIALADIFAGEVDFNSDLQPGDSFRLVIETYSRDGQFAGYGAILAAEFTNAGRRLRAVRFTPPGNKPAYYDERGRSLRRFFLKSPLKFVPVPQVTSRFSRRRLHPIDRIYKAHFGVDYRAPEGAAVVAVAGGVVSFAGMSGASGRMVRIRHASGYESSYLHLSSIARGLLFGSGATARSSTRSACKSTSRRENRLRPSIRRSSRACGIRCSRASALPFCLPSSLPAFADAAFGSKPERFHDHHRAHRAPRGKLVFSLRVLWAPW